MKPTSQDHPLPCSASSTDELHEDTMRDCQDLRLLEEQLSALLPTAMPEGMLSRMEQAMDNWIDTPLHCTAELEENLHEMAPARMSENLHSRLTNSMDNWHRYVPEEEKIVPLGNAKAETRQRGGMIAAAAAVAMLGAAAALLVPHFSGGPQPATVSHAQTPTYIPAEYPADTSARSGGAVRVSNQASDVWLAPDGLSTEVVSTTEEEVIHLNGQQPHRVIRVDYVNNVKVINGDGQEVNLQTPRRRFIVMPLEEN